MSTATAPTGSATDAPKKSKKLLVIGLAAFLVIALAGGGFFYMRAQKAAGDEESAEAAPAAAHSSHAAPAVPPTFLPLENMVVNLADPSGDRFIQIGITLEVADSKTVDTVKAYMPSIRNGILMLVSQRTSEELLSREGKEKLAEDIRREVGRPLGVDPDEESDDAAKHGSGTKKKAKKKKAAVNPVQGVLFSSFIVQ